MKKIHYAGAIETGKRRVLAGWAACCSGEKADRIRAEKLNTTAIDKVTCAACREIMLKAGISID